MHCTTPFPIKLTKRIFFCLFCQLYTLAVFAFDFINLHLIQHWKSIFDKYDVDGNGKISYRELKNMIRSSANTKDIPGRVVKMVMQKADLDDSGYLEYPEFIAMVNLCFHHKNKKLSLVAVLEHT